MAKEQSWHQYAVWEAESASELTEKIETALKNGWELYGYPFCATHQNGEATYCQAVVR